MAIKEQQHEYARSRADTQMLAEAARSEKLQITGHLMFGHFEHALAMAMDGYTGAQHYPIHTPLYGDARRFLAAAQFGFNATLGIASNAYNVNRFLSERELWTDTRLAEYWPRQHRTALLRDVRIRPDSDYSYPVQSLNMRDLMADGSYIAVGSESEPAGIGVHFQIWMMATGMDAMTALESASLHGARFLGMETDLGSIAVGKLADLIVLDRNPLENIRDTASIRFVMKDGNLYDSDLNLVAPARSVSAP